MDKYAMLKLR